MPQLDLMSYHQIQHNRILRKDDEKVLQEKFPALHERGGEAQSQGTVCHERVSLTLSGGGPVGEDDDRDIVPKFLSLLNFWGDY